MNAGTRLQPALIVLMGVAGSGKSTLAESLQRQLALVYIEADELHSSDNRRRMAAGLPLTDEMRGPWIEAICATITTLATDSLLACSALRRQHRDCFRRLDRRVLFIHLTASADTLQQRLGDRQQHFMPPSLLNSQLDSLDPTMEERDIIEFNTEMPLTQLVEQLKFIIKPFLAGMPS